MTFDNESADLRSAHVIVVGNEKGGAGKSTISIHLAVALLKAGRKVACIDLDTRQQTMTRFFENRKSWSANAPWPIELPRHCAMERGQSSDMRANEAHEFALFAEAIGAVEHDFEFVIIDTPASDSYLMRLAHSLADTLVSPLNDSYIDIDVFSRVHHDRSQRGAIAHYADLVLEARRKRRLVDNGVIDWIMVRNRMASIASNNSRQIGVSIGRLAGELRFRIAEGFHDRVIFRELFPIGLTALDPIEDAAASALTTSQQAARREIDALLATLDLPTREPGVEHLQSRRMWHARVSHYYDHAAAAASAYS
ncbi:MAG: AAA family ATPase [Hyphomicrobiales bacterium]|nr:AAA family ATPase [Hyphomicrobiales bacterium]MBV8663089.1 AAA family ATPase [Hyphomicrobiales bacterium]